jgi:hypothetical protein
VQLAIATSIPPAAWLAEDDAVIWTAVDILDEQQRNRKGGKTSHGR